MNHVNQRCEPRTLHIHPLECSYSLQSATEINEIARPKTWWACHHARHSTERRAILGNRQPFACAPLRLSITSDRDIFIFGMCAHVQHDACVKYVKFKHARCDADSYQLYIAMGVSGLRKGSTRCVFRRSFGYDSIFMISTATAAVAVAVRQ